MKTLKEENLKSAVLRLVEKSGAYVGIVLSDGKIRAEIHGDDADDVWRRLHDQAGAAHPNFFGFDGAKNRFLRIFSRGFASQGYAERERNYKLAAKRRLDETLPLEAALSGTGYGEAALAVFRASNLLSPFESMRIQEALRSPQADAFIRGAATFASGETKRGLVEMAAALKPHDVAKWTAVTYLPYLWRPEQHMYLKPNVTRQFAERVGHGFADVYSAALAPAIYESLLDLADTTAMKIADLSPADRIDIQSFIWVVGSYDEAAEKGLEGAEEANMP